MLLFPSMAAECRGHPGGDLSLISLRLMLIILQRLNLSLIYSLACGETKPNTKLSNNQLTVNLPLSKLLLQMFEVCCCSLRKVYGTETLQIDDALFKNILRAVLEPLGLVHLNCKNIRIFSLHVNVSVSYAHYLLLTFEMSAFETSATIPNTIEVN